MVNIEYCLSMEDFFGILDQSYPKGSKEVTGNCEVCSLRKRCIFSDKEKVINSLLSMRVEQSRFPRTLRILQKNPYLLYLVPAFVYKIVYGNGREYLECPYMSNKVKENTENIKKAYELLTTEQSKLTFLNILAYRMTLNRDYISRAYSPHPQYFIPEYRNLKCDEIFVDCGAFIGDSMELYCKYNAVPNIAYLFEPDERNIIKLKENVEEFTDRTAFNIITKGLYKKTGKLYFTSGMGSDSHFSEIPTADSTYVEVTSLDEAIKHRVSFIKMDIEGFEYDALLGGKQIIRNYYPKLAICVYHRIDDIWRIPLLIHNQFPKYNHYEIHQHKTFFSETVLYVWRS